MGIHMVTHSAAFFWSPFFGFQVSPARVPELVAMTKRAGAYVTATLDKTRTTAEVWGGNTAGITAFWSRPENRFMHWTEVALHEESITGPRWNPPGSAPCGLDARLAFIRDYTVALHEAGVPILAGTDSPTVFGVAGFSLHRELRELESLGFTLLEVLQIATRNGGEFVGPYTPTDLPFGTVSVGSRADLLLLEADPREPRQPDPTRRGDGPRPALQRRRPGGGAGGARGRAVAFTHVGFLLKPQRVDLGIERGAIDNLGHGPFIADDIGHCSLYRCG